MTASEIVKGQTGETNGGDRISGDVIWNYRTRLNADGTVQGFGRSTVCAADRADCIGVETDAGLELLDI